MSSKFNDDNSAFARREPRSRIRDPDSVMDPSRTNSQASVKSSSRHAGDTGFASDILNDDFDFGEHLSPIHSTTNNGAFRSSGRHGHPADLNIRLDGDDDHMDDSNTNDSDAGRRSRSPPDDRSTSGNRNNNDHATTTELPPSRSSTEMGDDISYDEEKWRRDSKGNLIERIFIDGRERQDELDMLNGEGTFKYGLADDGARITSEPARVQMFLKRSNNLVTPLIPYDELPATFALPGISRTMSKGAAWQFPDCSIYPDSLPRARVPFEPFSATGAASPNPTDGHVGAPVFNFGTAPTQSGSVPGLSGIKLEAADPNLVPDNQTWANRAGHYTNLLSEQWARQGKVLPGGFGAFPNSVNEGNQVYNPMTKGVFGRKLFCSHWLRTGECDFTQQGCNYLHLMPDLDTMEILGMKQYPRWFRELPRDAQTTFATQFDPRGLDLPSGPGRAAYNYHDRQGMSGPGRSPPRQRRNDGRGNGPRRDPVMAAHQFANPPRFAGSMAPPPVPHAPNHPFHPSGTAFAMPMNPGYYEPRYSHAPAGPPTVPVDGMGRPFSPLVSNFGGSRYPTPAPGTDFRPASRSSNLMDFDSSFGGSWTQQDGTHIGGAGSKRKDVPAQADVNADQKRARPDGPSLSPGPLGRTSDRSDAVHLAGGMPFGLPAKPPPSVHAHAHVHHDLVADTGVPDDGHSELQY